MLQDMMANVEKLMMEIVKAAPHNHRQTTVMFSISDTTGYCEEMKIILPDTEEIKQNVSD